jgi:hypothetical protein
MALIYALQNFTSTDGINCTKGGTFTVTETAANIAIQRGQAQLAEITPYQALANADYQNGKDIVNLINLDGTPASIDSTRIINPEKIERMVAKIGRAAYERVHVGYHGMSIVFGVGANNTTVYTGGESGRIKSVTAVLSKILNSTYGGTFSPGFDPCISSPGVVWGVTAPAAFAGPFSSAGPEGRAANPSTGSVEYTVTGGRAGQVVRFYTYATPTATPSTPVTARYSIAGANVVATTNATPSTGGPITPLLTGHWYEFSVTLSNAGDSTISVLNPASGGTIVIYGADYDYLTSPGITLHRLARSGAGITDNCAWALDATDTQPAGNWTTTGTALQQQQRRDAQFESMTSRIGNTGTPGVGIVGALCSFDVNDIVKSTAYGYSLADHYRHITNYVNKMNGAGIPVLFVCGHLRDPSTITTTQTQQDIIALYKRVSDESNSVCGASFLNLSINVGTPQQDYNYQWRDSQMAISGEVPPLHPNDNGHAKYGSIEANAYLASVNSIS